VTQLIGLCLDFGYFVYLLNVLGAGHSVHNNPSSRPCNDFGCVTARDKLSEYYYYYYYYYYLCERHSKWLV